MVSSKPLLFCQVNMIKETDPNKEPTSQQKYDLSRSVNTANFQDSKPENKVIICRKKKRSKSKKKRQETISINAILQLTRIDLSMEPEYNLLAPTTNVTTADVCP